MSDLLLQLALAVIPAILAITLHEAAHGYAALALGDDTARNAGRLSLNPLRHVDRVGTILLPGFLLVSQLLLAGRIYFMFGWAKPVPVAAWKFRNPRRYMALVAIAGPAMNFFLAWLGALLLPSDVADSSLVALGADFLVSFILFNVVLGLFNLLPIPPLDGFGVVFGLSPRPLKIALLPLLRYGPLILLLVLFLPQTQEYLSLYLNTGASLILSTLGGLVRGV